MPDVTPARRAKIAAARKELAEARAERAATEAKVAEARRAKRIAAIETAALEASAANRRLIATATRNLTDVTNRETAAALELARLDTTIGDVSGRLDGLLEVLTDPYAALDAQIPIALFPVRLETRYIGNELKVRIYPDTVHIDQLERQLTDEEQRYGHEFWAERWQNGTDDSAELWDRYASHGSSNRVAWIVAQTRPVNIDELGRGEPKFPELSLRPPGPSRAPTARLLPQRWRLVGYRNGEQVLSVLGKPIPDTVQAGVDPAAIDDQLPDTPGDPADLPDHQDGLAIDDGARWLVDYDDAVDLGMAITVTTTADGRLRDGYDRLMVIGVDHRTGPAEGGDELFDTLAAHHYSDGAGFVAVGTPTNASDEERVSPRPVASDPSAAVDTRGGRASELAEALGLPAAELLHRFDGGGGEHEPLARDLNTVLWEPTLGYFCRQILAPVVTDLNAGRLRTHFIDHVCAGGPLPVLRFGAQPMGVLPVTLLDEYGGDAVDEMLAPILRGMWRFWQYSTRTALRLGDGDDPAADLVALLERVDRSVAYRVRDAFGPVLMANTEGMQDLGEFQEFAALLTLALMGISERPEIVDITLGEDDWVAPVPLVTGTPSADPLDPDYIAKIASRLTNAGGRAVLRRDDPGDASTLLEALLIHAADLEITKASSSLVLGHLQLDLAVGAVLNSAEFVAESNITPTPRINEIAVVAASDDDEPQARRLNVEASVLPDVKINEISGRATLADLLTKPNAELKQFPETLQYREFRSALQRLRGRATDELHEAAAGALDLVSHRFDAWVTSLASRRLASQRSGDGAGAGVHIGGFGWVDDLRPATGRASAGYVHAPSIAQATTSAILRSGHLARTDGDAEPLEIDLSSRRTRDALELIGASRKGQSLAAVLGYRYERGLRDEGTELAQYILPSRQAHPLPDGGDSSTGPVEVIAARNVVDGVALAELDTAGRNAFLTAVGATGGHRDVILRQLDELVDGLDAVGDLLIAESVHQAVLGNTERAAAALDALDRQEMPPEVAVANTPRSGIGIGQRVGILLDQKRPPTSWNRLTDVRGNAAPLVNAWAGHVLGDPDEFALAANVLDAEGAVIETVTISLRALGMSPLSVVLSTTAGGEGSEFEQRLALEFAAAATAAGRAALQALPDTPIAGKRGLAELIALAHHLGGLLAAARPGDVRDLTAPSDTIEVVPDVAELAARVAAVRVATDAVAETDPEALGDLTDRQVTAVVEKAAALGYAGMIPTSDDREHLDELAIRAIGEARARRERADAVEAVAATAFAEGDAEMGRMSALLGDGFPFVPRMIVPAEVSAVVDAALGDAALQGKPLTATEWLHRAAHVRPSVERLWVALAASEAAGSNADTTQLSVVQLPRRVGEAWVGTPDAFTDGPPTADTSIVLHHLGASPSVKGSASMLVVDQWHEQVPSRSETTGVSFHFDGPGARAPQTMLLAVHPDRDAKQWSEQTVIDTVMQTADLAVMRGLDLDDVSAAGRFIPATYLPFDLSLPFLVFDIASLVKVATVLWNVEDD